MVLSGLDVCAIFPFDSALMINASSSDICFPATSHWDEEGNWEEEANYCEEKANPGRPPVMPKGK